MYDSAQNIFFDFENERFHSVRDTEMGQATERYFECDLLIIDDLGTEVASSFTVSCLYNIINTRQNRNKATINSVQYLFGTIQLLDYGHFLILSSFTR